MRLIVEMKFGSHLYGTSTPESDTDFKAVYLPEPEDIHDGTVRHHIQQNSKADHREKNTSNDTDQEIMSLERFMQLAGRGDVMALDMLFAPPNMLLEFSGVWLDILLNRERLLSRDSASFLKYCKDQADKYGIKGSRMASAQVAMQQLQEIVDHHGVSVKLGQFAEQLDLLAVAYPHIEIVHKNMPGDRTIGHLSVCGKMAPYTASVGSALATVTKLFDTYGERTRLAMKNEGVDWKALSHAVRVGYQTIELLDTGNITFPRPEAQHLIQIKQGLLPYQQVSEEIEDLMERVRYAAAVSILPKKPDQDWIDTFISSKHRAIIEENRT